MPTIIADIQKKYTGQLDHLDLELILAHAIKKTREFVLAHPEKTLTVNQQALITKFAKRKFENEPLAYILGSKEFFGYPFLVSPATLIPRPETELMVEVALEDIRSHQSSVTSIIDVGTGSGNIIISLAKNLNSIFYGIDISKDALRMAKRNAKINNVEKKIKFFHGNLLEPFIKKNKFKIGNSKIIILANLPYLSKKIYAASKPNVRNFEPKSALYSPREGLAHYEKLCKQIRILQHRYPLLQATCYIEISPEQKNSLQKLIQKYFFQTKIAFKKDLAHKWRLAIITL